MQVLDFLELVHDDLHFFTVVDAEFDGAVEDALVAADGQLVDVDAELVADDLAYIEQHTLAVDTLDFDGRIEEQLLVHIPFGIYDAVAVAGLQLGCYLAGTLVYLDAVLVVDKSHDVIARDGMATVWEDKLVDVLLCDDERFLLVEVLAHDEELLWLGGAFYLASSPCSFHRGMGYSYANCWICFSFLFLPCSSSKSFSPKMMVWLPRARKKLSCFWMLWKSQRLSTIDVAYLHAVLLEPLVEYFLALLLNLSIITAQDGLYLALCLGCADEVDPCLLYMLALTGEDFHLVATLQLMAERNQLVIDLGTDTVASQEGMDLESEVECRTVGWHRLDFSLRCEDEDF